ncbi:serine/threonine protein kinase [Thermomonospora umbrina]|nr:serine/threonine-protein kinase [Thermomonospora umbrina]
MGEVRLTGRLGSGDRGIVYLGRTKEGLPVAVRVPPASGATPASGAPPADGIAAGRLVSPWTARVLAVSSEGGLTRLVSEYVPGPSLAEAVERDGPRSGAALHRLAVATIGGLADMHRAGLVHRDLRPGAVVLGPDGPRIVDVAVGGLVTIMSPAYRAPEQLAGGEVTPATDVFSWAAVMVFASCGRHPFGPPTDPSVVTRILREQPDLGLLAGRLHEIALRCLAKDPRDRPTAEDVVRWLRQAEQPMPPAIPRRPSDHRREIALPARRETPVPSVNSAETSIPAGTTAPEVPASTVPRNVPAIAGRSHALGSPGTDTSGIEVRIRGRASGRRAAASERRRGRAARRNSTVAGLLAGTVLVGSALIVWNSGVADSALGRSSGRLAGGPGGEAVPSRTGPAVEVETTHGYRYRLSAIGYDADPQAVPAGQSPPPGTAYLHADYVLSNPLEKPVLLDLYTADVFVKRARLPEGARGRCMWHNGVPEDMCTPPAKPRVLSRLSGGPPTGGAGGDRYMAPGASYVVRVGLDLPMEADLRPGDLRLYVWRQTYMADTLVKEIPFPR